MKYLIASILISTCISVRAQKNTNTNLLIKAKINIVNNVKADAIFPKSYTPAGWSNLKALKRITGYNKGTDTAINNKIDTLQDLNRSIFPDGYSTIYILSHAFKVKTRSGEIVLKVYSYRLDTSMNIIDVDKSTPEEQIRKNREMIKTGEQEKILIKKISELEIANIKSQK